MPKTYPGLKKVTKTLFEKSAMPKKRKANKTTRKKRTAKRRAKR